MEIGLACHAFKHGGGMERYARDVAAGLVAYGFRPRVYSRVFDSSLDVFPDISPVKVDKRWLPKKLRDIYYFFGVGNKSAELNLLICCTPLRKSDIAICGGNHLGFLSAMSQRRRRLSDRLKIALDRKGYQGANCVVAHSERMKVELIDFYRVPEERIRVIYPPVDSQRFGVATEAQRQAARQRFGFQDNEVVFALPSTSHLRKGVDLLNKYFENTTLPVVLAVAGDRFSSSHARVRSLGYIQDIERLYQAADYTVVASRYEPFGLVGVESVLCGTPLILAENVGCREVIANEAYQSFSIDNPDSLASAIEAAVEKCHTMTSRIADPGEALLYQPGVKNHIQALLEVCSPD